MRIFGNIVEEVGERALLTIVVVGHHFQIAQDSVSIMGVLIVQDNDVFAVIAERFALRVFDDQGTIGSVGFLKAGMAVIPVGSRLNDRELVGEGFAGFNAIKADGRHAIHLKRQDQAMPVDRG